MHKHSSAKNVLVMAMLMAALMLSGCETAGNWLKGRRTADATDPVILGAPQANTYLMELQQLTSGDPATQAEIYADAEAAAKLTPGPSTELRYALVLATAGHPGSNPADAQRMLRGLLSQSEMLTAAENALATIFLKDVEDRLVLGAEARRLREENSRTATTEEAAINERIARIEAENRRLRQLLADTEDKLEAISSIERSMREQSEDQVPR